MPRSRMPYQPYGQDGLTPIRPTSSISEPPPGSNGIGRWAAAEIAAMGTRLDIELRHLSERHHETRAEMIAWQRHQDSTLWRHAEVLAALNARSQTPEQKSIKARIEDWKALGSAALWLAGAGLMAVNAMSLIPPGWYARLTAGLAAFGGAP